MYTIYIIIIKQLKLKNFRYIWRINIFYKVSIKINLKDWILILNGIQADKFQWPQYFL